MHARTHTRTHTHTPPPNQQEKVRQREARRKLVDKKRAQSMSSLAKEAEKRAAEFERKEAMVEDVQGQAWTDNSRRAYFREFKKVCVWSMFAVWCVCVRANAWE